MSKYNDYKVAWAREKRKKQLKEDPENFRKKRAIQERKRRKALKEKVYAKFGNKCNNPACQWLMPDGLRGCSDTRCLQIDHKFGDAKKDEKNGYARGSNKFLKAVLEDLENRYQLLCANCNWIKRFINGEDNAYHD
jgi:hypothetical protein